ncbi:MAG: Asp-tRNA(Asn)/Glu-tRNA(Gln) amidotransferase subunit GatC [Phascolarctobacterium sp.]|nr:Asp-tRNA(Asn)/Glu-tRNA(Gln) amidotransferase subunit GatC [Phascolarctobacterium sp.]
MKVTADIAKRIADLTKVIIPEAEMDAYLEHYNKVFDYADELQKLDTENVEPTVYILPIYNAFREDVALEGVSQEVALKDAPAVHNGGFKVPRVME